MSEINILILNIGVWLELQWMWCSLSEVLVLEYGNTILLQDRVAHGSLRGVIHSCF